MKTAGIIFNITRGSLHDGDGIRTVVYFKGCPLRCAWCHNPESFSVAPDIFYHESKCISCGRCVSVCPEHHEIVGDRVIYQRDGCTKCGKCADVCPNEALLKCGGEYSVDDVLKIVLKDKRYYINSGGGVTISGGECFLQHEFLLAVLKALKSEQINTAVETAFDIGWDMIEPVIEYVDTFIIDIKHMDSAAHKLYTGSDNRQILANIKKLSHIHGDIWIRVPLIPGVNDGDANLIDTAEFVNTCGSGIKKIELLKYNNLANNKYIGLGRKRLREGFGELNPQTDAEMVYKQNVVDEHIKNGIR